MEKDTDKKAYAHAEKAYMQGSIYPFIRVGMQKVNLTPTVTVVDGKNEATLSNCRPLLPNTVKCVVMTAVSIIYALSI